MYELAGGGIYELKWKRKEVEDRGAFFFIVKIGEQSGDRHEDEVDYYGTYTPVTKLVSLGVVLTIACYAWFGCLSMEGCLRGRSI